jgi:16S rRNA (cytosine967-C5)-methyltransferase
MPDSPSPSQQPAARHTPRSPRHAELRAYLADLYARLIASSAPPDHFIGGYFRLRPNIVGGARGFLAATLYALLRQRYRTLALWRWAGRTEPRFPWPEPGSIPAEAPPPGLEAGLAIHRWLREDMGESPADALELAREALELARALPAPKNPGAPAPVWSPGNELDEFAQALEADPDLKAAPDEERLGARLSLPSDLVARWRARFGDEALAKLGQAFRETAPLDLRVNTLLTTPQEVAASLAEEGVETFPAPYSPHGLRLARKSSLKKTKAWRRGWIETQDEGSQIVALALSPEPGWRVLDACAGGGGKSLHLIALMEGRGEVVARDIDSARLDAIGKRAARCRAEESISRWGPGEPPPPAASFDAVLIDAPCLGLGTLRRNPHFACFGPLGQRLKDIRRAQREILEEYCPLTRPGAALVYAVCSFEPEETTELIDAFLADHPEFEPDPLEPVFRRRGMEALLKGMPPGAWRLTLLPHERQTDGFFICRLRRRPAPAKPRT